MILVDEGRLGLNRPVQEYIPEFVGDGKDAVMVHHLMTHTAGLNDDELVAYAEQRKGSIEIPPLVPTTHPVVHEDLYPIYDAPLWKPPGMEMLYSPYGYEILGDIVGRVASQPLADFARDRVPEQATNNLRPICSARSRGLRRRRARLDLLRFDGSSSDRAGLFDRQSSTG